MSIISSLELTSRFISLASTVLSAFTFSFCCQAIFVIITILSTHYPILSLQAQNVLFQQIFPTLINFWYPYSTAFEDHLTDLDLYYVHWFIF